MNNDTANQIKKLDTQIAFLGALMFAVGINILITTIYKNIAINGNKSKNSIKKIFKLAVLSSTIFFIVTIYFFILALDEYESNPNQTNFNFYMATVLSFLAQSIRWNTLLKHPSDIFGVEDIV